ncbi:MAG: hypothetical protein LBS29_04900 [Endomicrobium sp.]|jgi:hypothetical protein|nr:hypothetical protein [Endomicrobium sp.]
MKTFYYDNFRVLLKDKKEVEYEYDERHHIYSCNNDYSLQQYVNYLSVITTFVNVKEKNGYLDIGFLPVLILPSFFYHSNITWNQYILDNLPLEKYNRPPISFNRREYTGDTPDTWIAKYDAAKYTNKAIHEVRVKHVLEKLFNMKFK